MGQESTITIQLVYGGFILHSGVPQGPAGLLTSHTEVFTSQGKLMKAIRSAIDEGSLVKKEKEEAEPAS